MGAAGEIAVGLVMLVGIAGVVVPVLPGLLLIWGATVGWALAEGTTTGWVVAAIVTVVSLSGTAAKYVLPGRTLRDAGAPRSTILAGAGGAIVGFFVLPVIGALVGVVAGVLLAELARLHDRTAAWRSTSATLRAVGLGIVLELVAAVLAVAVWLIGAVVT